MDMRNMLNNNNVRRNEGMAHDNAVARGNYVDIVLYEKMTSHLCIYLFVYNCRNAVLGGKLIGEFVGERLGVDGTTA